MKNLNFYSLDASNNQILRMIVNEIGNVGIGTSVASKKLEVTGDISFNGDLYQNGELFTGGSTIDETTDVSLNNLVIHGDLSANDASFNVIDVNTILIDGRDLISGAPEALDTLNELAAALDNSANFATNVTTTLSSIQSQLSTKQDSISTNDLSLGDINGLYLQLDSKQDTITANDLTIAFTSGLQTALDSKHPLINETIDVSLNNLKVHGDLSANDASFNVIDVNTILIDGRDLISGAPEALDTLNELAAALDNSANFATNVTTTLSSIQSQLSTKQDTISTNDLSLGDINGLYTQLNSKQDTITTNDLTIAFTSGLQTALDSKHPLINETTDVSLNNLKIHGDLSANDASFNVIDASSVNTTGTSFMNSIIPSANNLYSLGDASNVWKDVYIGPGSLYIDGQKVLESDADTIVVGADENQNLKVNTHGSGVLQMESASGIQITTTGSGNIELGSTGSGIVRITDNLALNGDIEIYNDSTNEVKINDNLNVTGDYLQNGTNINTIYATLASPSLTGTPVAPTATSGTNTTQIATTAFVSTAVSNLVNGAPGALDTLSELASALDNSGNFATNVTNTLGSLQTQIDTKQATISSSTRLNANLIHNGTVSNTEYGYLNGVTSAIQTQLDTKITASSTSTLTNKTLTSPIISSISNTGTLTLPTSTGTIALTSDIPTQITNNNQLINGAGYITASSTSTLTNLIVGGSTYQSATAPTNGLLVEGNVGIGTTNPEAPLHIKFTQPGDPTNNIKDMIKIETEYSTDFSGSYREGGSSILFYVENTYDPDGQGYPGEAARIVSGCYETSSTSEYHSYLAFHTSNNSSSTGTNERMVIDDNGYVGIGTTIPGDKLHIQDVNDTTLKIESGINTSNKTANILFRTDDTGVSQSHYDSAKIVSGFHSTPFTSSYISFQTHHSTSATFNDSMTIRGGNVGIGTTDPKNKLDVEGAAVIGATYSGTNTAPTNGMLVEGNVGIGTTNPNERLHVIGNAVFQKPSSSTDYTSNSTHGINLIPYGGDSGGNTGGRIFFDETVNGVQNYGFSLGYNGGSDSAILNWKTNTFNINRHEANAIGATVLSISRASSHFKLNATTTIGADDEGEGFLINLGSTGTVKGGTAGASYRHGYLLGDGNKNIVLLNQEDGMIRIGSGNVSNGICIDTNNNVGIGTTSPRCLFNTANYITNSDTTIPIGAGSLNNTTSAFFAKSSSDSDNRFGLIIGSLWNGKSYIQTSHIGNYTYDILLNPIGGNVGIGTTSTGEKLEIFDGNIKILQNANNDDIRGILFKNNTYPRTFYMCAETFGPGLTDHNLYIGYTEDTNISDQSYIDGSILTVRGDGNVGIGTTNPACLLDIRSGDAGEAKLMLCGTIQGTGNIYIGQSTSFGGGMIYNGDGTPSHSGSTTDHISFYRTSAGTHYEVFKYNTGSNNVIFNGRVGVGVGSSSPDDFLTVRHPATTSPSYRGIGLEQNSGTVRWRTALAGNSGTADCYSLWYNRFGTNTCQIHADNQSHIVNGLKVGASGSSSYTFEVVGSTFSSSGWSGSDDRIKHNEKAVENAIEIIKKLEVKKYYKSEKIYDRNHHYELDGSGNPITDDKYVEECGIIAQQIKTIPELAFCVNGEEEIEETVKNYEDGSEETVIKQTPLGVNYTNLFCYNIQAVQDLIKKVESHENEIESLKMFNTESNNTLNNLIQENQQIKQENQQIKQENQQIKQQIQYIMQHLGL